MATRFIRVSEACKRTGLSRAAIYRGVGVWLPQLYKITSNAPTAPSGFIEDQFEACLQARIDAQRGSHDAKSSP